MKRRELREHIFKLLFLAEFNQANEMNQQLSMYFQELEDLSEVDQQYMKEKYEFVKAKLPEIDEMINEASNGWKTSRMSKVDLAILRLAVYEMKFDEDVPMKVAINEAVELSKSFGQNESAAFINGVLGKLS